MAKKKDYRDIIKKILADHPEIASINIEYKKVERLTIGEQAGEVFSTTDGSYVPSPPVVGGGFQTPSGLRPIVPTTVSPELIAKLRGGATVETINILNAPPAKEAPER